MKVYEVIFNDRADYEPYEERYGIFSTREKAEELLNQFQKYDTFDPDDYYIIEHEVDELAEWVTKKLENLKEQYEEDEEES